MELLKLVASGLPHIPNQPHSAGPSEWSFVQPINYKSWCSPGIYSGTSLFLIYINDLPQSLVYSDPNLFADDTTLLEHNSNLTVIQESLSEDLTNVSQRTSSNRVILNHKKTNLWKFTPSANFKL